MDLVSLDSASSLVVRKPSSEIVAKAIDHGLGGGEVGIGGGLVENKGGGTVWDYWADLKGFGGWCTVYYLLILGQAWPPIRLLCLCTLAQ